MANKRGKGKKSRRQGQRTKSSYKVNDAPTMISIDVAQGSKKTKDQAQNNQSKPGEKNLGLGERLTRFINLPLVTILIIILAFVINNGSGIFSGWLGSAAQRDDTKSGDRAVVNLVEVSFDMDQGIAFLGLQQTGGRRPADQVRIEVREIRALHYGNGQPITIGTHTETFETGEAKVPQAPGVHRSAVQLHGYSPTERTRIQDGTEVVSLTGTITYADGVGGRSEIPLCQIYRRISSTPQWETCGVFTSPTTMSDEEAIEEVLKKFKSEDLYPPDKPLARVPQ